MGAVLPPSLVTPIVALLYGREEDYAPLVPALEELFGPRELESPVFAFESTAYYREAMGEGLQRRFLTFQRLADPGGLAAWKRSANALEARFAKDWAGKGRPRRPVNIDPGYLTGAKLVLASSKDFAHRIYLRDGIFAEITLAYRGAKWLPQTYTFPDFRAPAYHGFLSQARARHLRKLGAPR